MTLILNRSNLDSTDIGWEFQGKQYDNTPFTFIIVEAPPGTGPRLHSHSYQEVFIIQAGQATFTVGAETFEVVEGQIVVAPADVPHKFINSGSGVLRQVDIHASPRFITKWLEE